MSALMGVEEADEVNKSESEAASAMMLLSPQWHRMRSLRNDPVASTEPPADAVEQILLSGSGVLLQNVQKQDRSDDLTGLAVHVRSPLLKSARTHGFTHSTQLTSSHNHEMPSTSVSWQLVVFNAEIILPVCSIYELTCRGSAGSVSSLVSAGSVSGNVPPFLEALSEVRMMSACTPDAPYTCK